jgi:hypothetical protein
MKNKGLKQKDTFRILKSDYRTITKTDYIGNKSGSRLPATGTEHRAQGTGLRAQRTGHRAQGLGHSAQGTAHMAHNKLTPDAFSHRSFGEGSLSPVT